MTVRILVDSTADLPPEQARALHIEVVPLTVMFGDVSYRDGVDLDGPAFYAKLSRSPVMPTTSTPPPALFEERYRTLIQGGATGILALHISSSLSATVSVSTLAAQAVSAETGVPIEVIDSRSVSGGYGVPAEIVAREALAGKNLPELKAHVESSVRRFDSVNVVGLLPAAEKPAKTQALIYTAHYDHLGIAPEDTGDRIYNGAVDNATGCGILLELAKAWGSMKQKQPQPVLFAAVTAEEKGLL
nr:DegV family EDD domain-containing protein [Ktedonobacterales bacterium]